MRMIQERSRAIHAPVFEDRVLGTIERRGTLALGNPIAESPNLEHRGNHAAGEQAPDVVAAPVVEIPAIESDVLELRGVNRLADL